MTWPFSPKPDPHKARLKAGEALRDARARKDTRDEHRALVALQDATNAELALIRAKRSMPIRSRDRVKEYAATRRAMIAGDARWL